MEDRSAVIEAREPIPLEPRRRDVLVYKNPDLRTFFFGKAARLSWDGDDQKTLIIEFEEGGRVEVHTRGPALWIEPDRH
jgi:hypothetical protein